MIGLIRAPVDADERRLWRDFADGAAVVNPPGNPTRMVNLGAGFADLDGVAATQLTLPSGTV